MKQIVCLIIVVFCGLGEAQVQPLIPIHPSLQGHLLRSRRDEILPNYQPTDSHPTYSDNGYPQKSLSHPTYVEVQTTPKYGEDLPSYEVHNHLQSYGESLSPTIEAHSAPYEVQHSHQLDVEPNYHTEDHLSSNYGDMLDYPNYSSALEYEEDIQNIPNYLPSSEIKEPYDNLPSYVNEQSEDGYPSDEANQATIYNQPQNPEYVENSLQYHEELAYQESQELPLYSSASIRKPDHDHEHELDQYKPQNGGSSEYEDSDVLSNYASTLSEVPVGGDYENHYYKETETQEYEGSIQHYEEHYPENHDFPSYEPKGDEETVSQPYEEPNNSPYYQEDYESLPFYKAVESEEKPLQQYEISPDAEVESPYVKEPNQNYPQYYESDELPAYTVDHPHQDPVHDDDVAYPYPVESIYAEPSAYEEPTTRHYSIEDQYAAPSVEYFSPPAVTYQQPPTTYAAPGSYSAPEETMPATDYVAPGEYPQPVANPVTITPTTTTATTTTSTTTTTPTAPIPTTEIPVESDRSDSFQKITLTLVQSLTTLIANVLTNPPPTKEPVAQTTPSPTTLAPVTTTLPPPPTTTVPPTTASSLPPSSKAPEPGTTPMPAPVLLPTPPPTTLAPPPPPSTPTPTSTSPSTTPISIVPILPQAPEKMEQMPEAIEKMPKQMPPKMDAIPEKMEAMPPKMEDMPKKMEDMPKKMEDMPKKMEEMPKKMDDMPKNIDKMPDEMEKSPENMEKMPVKMDKMMPELAGMPKDMNKMPPKEMEKMPEKIMAMPKTMAEATTPTSTLEQAVKDLDDLIQQLSSLAG